MGRLPNFVVIGAMRSGTTSLYSYLREHPDVFMSREKETDYFSLGDQPRLECPADHRRAHDWAEYVQMFDGARDHRAVGEASPTYLFLHRSAARLQSAFPDVKLICILRDPVERAYSHYCFNRKMNLEPIEDFERAIAEEPNRPASLTGLRWAYTAGSRYHHGLREFSSRFPAQQLRVVWFEDLASDPAKTMSAIYGYIGVRPDFIPDVSVRHNRSGFLRNDLLSKAVNGPRKVRRFLQRNLPPRWTTRIGDVLMKKPPSLSAERRNRLLPYFEDDVRRLEGLLERDLSAWRTPRPS